MKNAIGSEFARRVERAKPKQVFRSELIECLESRALLSAVATSTVLAESLTSSPYGQSITLTAKVTAKSGKAVGAVTFKDGSTTLGSGTLNSSQQATFSLATLPVGSDSLTAVYAGTSAFASSTSAAVEQTVAKASTTTALSVSVASSVFGQSITLTAAVSAKSPGGGVPAGTVTFKSGSTTLSTVTLSSKGVATLSTGAIAVGTAAISATFNGSTDYAGSLSSSVSHAVSIAVTKTTLSESISSSLLGQTVDVTVAVTAASPSTGTPTGTVTLYDGKTVLITQTLVSGKFTGALPILFTGSHSLTAVYTATADFKTSTSSSATLTVKLPKMTTASNGLETGTVTAGTGNGAVDGQSLHVNYRGYLTNGTVFDSSLKPGRTPFDFTLGAGQVITGWDQGMLGLKVGEVRVLQIPPALGYGSTAQSSIPANSTLIFVVQLLSFNEPKLVVTGGKSVSISDGETPATADGTIFTSVKADTTGIAETFTLSNGGLADLNFTATNPIVISGVNASEFIITQPLFANGDATFTVTFKPTTKGLAKAAVAILTNDPTYPTFSFPVEGTGD